MEFSMRKGKALSRFMDTLLNGVDSVTSFSNVPEGKGLLYK